MQTLRWAARGPRAAHRSVGKNEHASAQIWGAAHWTYLPFIILKEKTYRGPELPLPRPGVKLRMGPLINEQGEPGEVASCTN